MKMLVTSGAILLLCGGLCRTALNGASAVTSVATPAATSATFSGGDPFAVLAYYSGNRRTIDDYPVAKLTHIIYSFLHLKGQRLAFDNPRDSAEVMYLVSLKSRHPGLKVMISLGGWGGCASCSDLFTSERGRREFAESSLQILKESGADGIDIDWEYPAIEGYPGHRYSPEDRHNFTLLMEELRKRLGIGYEISFAAGGFSECLAGSFEWKGVMPYVDRVNLMTYDMVNATSTATGHLAPLFSTPHQRESTDNAVRIMDSLGVDRRKVVIGLAFYGRVWSDVADKENGLFQSGKFLTYVNYKNLDGFFAKEGGFRTFWDSTAQSPYGYSSKSRLFATYDDPRSVTLKTEYAMEKKLGGVMFWELTGDRTQNGLLDAIDAARKETH
jgi:chitinase